MRFLMGTYWTIEAADKDINKAKDGIERAFAEIKRIEGLLSRLKAGSDISRLNQALSQKPVEVTEETFKLIKLGIDYSQMTKGAFDITVGPLLSLWSLAEKRGVMPSDEEIEFEKSFVGAQNIMLDPISNAVSFKKNGANIDLGGLGKGYGIDRAIGILSDYGISEAIINAGGEIFVLGKSFSTFGIKNPWRINEIIEEVKIKNQALSTSGNYERYYNIGGKHFGHIINSETGYPENKLKSVSVVAKTAIEADIFSTAAFIMGAEEFKLLARNIKTIDYIIIISGDHEEKIHVEKIESSN